MRQGIREVGKLGLGKSEEMRCRDRVTKTLEHGREFGLTGQRKQDKKPGRKETEAKSQEIYVMESVCG